MAKQYIEYNGEKCEVIEIVNRSARIKTAKGEKIILIPKDFEAQETKQEQKAESEIDFDTMTKAELIDYADEHGIEVNAKMRKGEIIDAINS